MRAQSEGVRHLDRERTQARCVKARLYCLIPVEWAGPLLHPGRHLGLGEGTTSGAWSDPPSKPLRRGGGPGGGGKRETRRVKGGFSKGALRGTRRASHPWRRGASRRASRFSRRGASKPPFSKPPFARNEEPSRETRSPPFRNPFGEAPLHEDPSKSPLLEAPLLETSFVKREASLFEAPSRSHVPPFFVFSARTTTTTTTTTSLAPTTYTKTCPAYTSPFLKPTHGRHTFSPPGGRDEGSKGRSLRRGLRGPPKPFEALEAPFPFFLIVDWAFDGTSTPLLERLIGN